MVSANYAVPLAPVYVPYRGFVRSPEPGLQVQQIEKAALRRDREFRGQASPRERQETFSQCYTRLLNLQDSKRNND
jgi:hypothetical protein